MAARAMFAGGERGGAAARGGQGGSVLVVVMGSWVGLRCARGRPSQVGAFALCSGWSNRSRWLPGHLSRSTARIVSGDQIGAGSPRKGREGKGATRPERQSGIHGDVEHGEEDGGGGGRDAGAAPPPPRRLLPGDLPRPLPRAPQVRAPAPM